MQRTDGQSILPCALGSGEKLQAGFPAKGAALVQVHQSVETHATRGHHEQRCARGAPCRMPYAHTARAPASATPHSTCVSCMLVRLQADSIYHGRAMFRALSPVGKLGTLTPKASARS